MDDERDRREEHEEAEYRAMEARDAEIARLESLLASERRARESDNALSEQTAVQLLNQRDAALARLEEATALLNVVAPLVDRLATENPRWQDSDGDVQDPHGINATNERLVEFLAAKGAK